MANSKNPQGKRVFDNVYSFPQDSQDLADDIFAASLVRVGTAQQRQDLPVAHLRDGLTWIETDTTSTDGLRVTKQWFTGLGWVRFPFEKAWETLVASTGWTANSGSGAPRVTRDGDTVFYQGGLFGGTANSTATVIPAWARPSREVRVVAFAADGVTPMMVRILANGTFSPAGTVVRLESALTWTVR